VKRFTKPVKLILLCAGLALHAGCKPDSPIKAFRGSLVGINRVAFVELAERNSCPGVAGEMTVALSHAIQAHKLFDVDVIDRQAPICKTVSLDGREGFTLEQLRQMRQTFRSDGILLGSISDFRSHPQMALGLSLRLLDLKRGQLVWEVNHVWDTTDKAVEKRIERFFKEHMRVAGYEPIYSNIIMTSPKAFEKFIAHEVAETLPGATE